MNYTISGFGDEISADLEEQLATLKGLGVDGLDLRTAFGKNVSTLTDEEVTAVREKAESYGLKIQAIGSPVNKAKYSDAARTEQYEKLKRIIQIAKIAGTRRIRIFSPETDREGGGEAWPEVRTWMAEQVALAEAEDVILMHENDGHFFGAFPANSRLLMEEFAGPHFRAIYDPGNAVLLGTRTMRDWFPWTLPFLDTIHVKDAIVGGHFVFAGEGDGEMIALLDFLKQNNWSGALTLEPHAQVAGPAGGFSGKENFTRAVTALRKCLSEVGA
jgi:sugar phosphate isomerase/epimerase